MSVLDVIWRAHRRSTRHAWRQDAGVRMTAMIRTIFLVVIGLRLVNEWVGVVSAWGQLPAVEAESRLLALSLGGMLPVAVLGAWSTYQTGFATDEALLLITLPIRPQDRFRALLLRTLAEEIHLLAFAGIVLGATFLLGLGWHGTG